MIVIRGRPKIIENKVYKIPGSQINKKIFLNIKLSVTIITILTAACNQASVLGENYDRNLHDYSKLMTQKSFISFKRFLEGGHFMDLDWLGDNLNSYYPFNEKLINKEEIIFHVVATNVETGKPEYFIPKSKKVHTILKASSAIPIAFNFFIRINDKLFTGGGLSAPLPIRYAIDHGATEIIILRTKSHLYRSKADQLYLI